jgi:NADH-quinone oxidoreductase subunit B
MNGTDVAQVGQPSAVEIPADLSQNVFVTTLDKLYNWSRASSMWPMMFGLACCAIEMICTAASRYDLARFGMEVMRPSPRQSDLMIVSGTVTKKMVPQIVRIYNQMAEPKYVISMGACATGGGPFKEGYNVVSGIDKYVPVDVYVPGCPPTPEALLNGFLKLFEKLEQQSVTRVPWYRKSDLLVPEVPILGPDIFKPEEAAMIAAKLRGEGQAVAVEAEVVTAKAPRAGRAMSAEEQATRRAKLAERRAGWQAKGKTVLTEEQFQAYMAKTRKDLAERKAQGIIHS